MNNAGEVRFVSDGVRSYYYVYGNSFLECRKSIRSLCWYRDISDILIDHVSVDDGLKCICISRFGAAAFAPLMRGLG